MGRMSTHVLAARCTVCLKVDDPLCPCGIPSHLHGIANQNPFTSDLIYSDGTRHEWHPQCIPSPDRQENRDGLE